MASDLEDAERLFLTPQAWGAHGGFMQRPSRNGARWLSSEASIAQAAMGFTAHTPVTPPTISIVAGAADSERSMNLEPLHLSSSHTAEDAHAGANVSPLCGLYDV